MVTGKITRSTYIAGEPVEKDEVVEVDETTFAILHRCGKIEHHKPDADEAMAAAKAAAPKFKRAEKPKSE